MPSWDAWWGEAVPVQDEVEEFASLLRHLKARTGRSYAALARRLDMNASTLHRYCAGGAVPLGFAPVERFAAMCQASTAERIELHRRWVLAVAARQRPGTAAASSPQDAGARQAGSEGLLTGGAAERAPTTAADSVSTTAADPVPVAASGPRPAPGRPVQAASPARRTSTTQRRAPPRDSPGPGAAWRSPQLS